MAEEKKKDGRGGYRANGGRKPGARNKRTNEAIRKAEQGGEMPLEYMLRVMRQPLPKLPDPKKVPPEVFTAALSNRKAQEARSDEAARSAAPYCHAKLASIEHTGKDGKDLVPEISDAELVRRIAFVLTKAGG